MQLTCKTQATTDIDGDGEAQEYCVSGKTLNMGSTMPIAGMMDDLAFTMTPQKQ